jgi:hypothetical protein
MKKFGRKRFADFADSRGYCYTMIHLAKDYSLAELQKNDACK